MFNTGDLGRMLPDGSLEHFGRVDDQVKIKVGRSIHEHSSIRTLLTRRGDRRTVGCMVSHFRLRHRSRCSITCLTINLQERK